MKIIKKRQAAIVFDPDREPILVLPTLRAMGNSMRDKAPDHIIDSAILMSLLIPKNSDLYDELCNRFFAEMDQIMGKIQEEEANERD